ncbi:MAG: response regulator [Elusimicrobia bacterium]|nr:response regulator [Elusimicrobiota bacterium]
MADSKKQKVVVADGDKDIRFLIQMYLRDFEVEFVEARDGKQCLELIESVKPDLIIMNYMLDKATGYQVAKEISVNPVLKKIPIVMMILEGFDLIEENVGLSDFIAKPFNRNEFINTIKKVLGDNMFPEREKRKALKAAAGKEPEKKKKDTRTGMKKILVADDDPNVIKLMKVVLQDDYSLVFASSGEDLVTKARKERYDLIISDIVMPKLSGWKSIKKLREEGLNVPVLFNSGLVKDKELYETLKPEGPSRFILKPFKKEDLLLMVKELIEN